MNEETTRETIARLRAKAVALGIGKSAKAETLKRKMKEQSAPTGEQVLTHGSFDLQGQRGRGKGKSGFPVKRRDTGETWPTLTACTKANGFRTGALNLAFHRAIGFPRVAVYRGIEFVYVHEERAAIDQSGRAA